MNQKTILIRIFTEPDEVENVPWDIYVAISIVVVGVFVIIHKRSLLTFLSTVVKDEWDQGLQILLEQADWGCKSIWSKTNGIAKESWS